MNCVQGLFLFFCLNLGLAEVVWAKKPLTGPCTHSLLASGDREQDTTEFQSYLEILIEKRVIRIAQLDSFLKSLEQNKIVNPILNKDENKHIAFAYRKFQELIEAHSIDPSKIKTWANEYIQKSQVVENQKNQAKDESKAAVYISPKGAMFFKIKHPILGDAYKILKPGSHPQDQGAWEDKVWAVQPLQSNGVLRSFTNLGGDDLPDYTVSKQTEARKACVELGGGADLPTLDDFDRLIRHFDFYSGGEDHDVIGLSTDGFDQFRNVFPMLYSIRLWTATAWTTEQPLSPRVYVYEVKDYGYMKAFQFSAGRDDQSYVICIAPR